MIDRSEPTALSDDELVATLRRAYLSIPGSRAEARDRVARIHELELELDARALDRQRVYAL
jgi:hypothetical protein